jgi:hypothetical protein
VGLVPRLVEQRDDQGQEIDRRRADLDGEWLAARRPGRHHWQLDVQQLERPDRRRPDNRRRLLRPHGRRAEDECCSANYNNVYVARSTDGGAHYTASLVFHAAPFTRLNNFWPVVAVDSTRGTVWTAWTDQHGVWVSSSTDHGATWSMAIKVSTIATTVMPWIAARNGKVDVVYYGSSAPSPDDTSAVWNVYDSQTTGGAWSVKQVSNTPNRIGRVCLEGSGCVGNVDRELLDLFEVAEDPLSGKAAVIYTDSQLST